MLPKLSLTLLLPLLAALLLAGCGRKSAAAPAAAPPLPAQGAIVAHPANPAQGSALVIPPDRLVIPAIQLDTPVVELGWNTHKDGSGSIFSEWDVAEYAAGWHKNSAKLGEAGNLVMSGHNNILGA